MVGSKAKETAGPAPRGRKGVGVHLDHRPENPAAHVSTLRAWVLLHAPSCWMGRHVQGHVFGRRKDAIIFRGRECTTLSGRSRCAIRRAQVAAAP